MKTNILVTAFAFSFLVLSVSCDNTGAPTIDFHELGYENSKTATAGDEFHMDAEIVAENGIDRIEVEIHHEGDEHMKSVFDGHEWEFDSVYTEFSGLKNTEFHEHIDIPAEAEAGDYHFHFAVIDMEGYETVFEDEVEILAPAK